jgi:hypothetical protein
MIVVLNTIEEIVREGDWRALGLLTLAGDNVTGIAKQLSITTPQGKMKFEEFRQYSIQRLQERLGAKRPDSSTGPPSPRVFISYNHSDRELANALALELARAKTNVFLDHWEMAPQEELLPRIERELQTSDVVIPLLSVRSSASDWVRRELDIAIRRQETEGRVLLLPVLLESCELPVAVATRPYLDLRDVSRLPAVAQAILNQLLGIEPFSQRVLSFINTAAANSPYTKTAQLNGRRLLQELAKHPEMDIFRNQKWLLWELFHKFLARYTCTLKMVREGSPGDASEHYSFVIVDRWNQSISSVVLTPQEFERGLWQGELDLLNRQILRSNRLRFMGSLGRFSYDSAFNPNVDINTVEVTSAKPMKHVLQALLAICRQFDEGSQQSFLFDYQRLVLPNDWHRVNVVAGSASGSDTLAYSHLVASGERDEVCAVFELYDPFFASLKYTRAYRAQLRHLWEGDVDLMSRQTETLLGLG